MLQLNQLCDAIENSTCSNNSGVLPLQNCFTQNELSIIDNFFNTYKGKPLHLQEHKPRLERNLKGHFDDRHERLLQLANKHLDYTAEAFDIMLWEDSNGYKIDPHYDDYVMSAIQIYLSSPNMPPKNLGTTFYNGTFNKDTGPVVESVDVDIPFVPNNGYFCPSSQNILHGSGGTVKENEQRRSIYIYFHKAEE
tara:strand:+ start:4052 stop:4633 length:582 start_codon:yes stop_codon:yes gene_type:complete